MVPEAQSPVRGNAAVNTTGQRGRCIVSEGTPAGPGIPFEALSRRLRSIARRAAAEAWPGWTAEDTRAIDTAARELSTFGPALAHGMREAFAIGREYGHREDVLDRLNQEIFNATNRLGRAAWGGQDVEDTHESRPFDG